MSPKSDEKSTQAGFETAAIFVAARDGDENHVSSLGSKWG